MYKATEIKFASLDKLITNIKLMFETPLSKVNFCGHARVVPDLSIGWKNVSGWLHLRFGTCLAIDSGNANKICVVPALILWLEIITMYLLGMA